MEFECLCDMCGCTIPMPKGYHICVFSYEQLLEADPNDLGILQPDSLMNLCEDCKNRLGVFLNAARLSYELRKEDKDANN